MPKKSEICFKIRKILTYQILTNDDEVCIPSLSSILFKLYDTSSRLVFVRFLEEIKTPESPFEIN